MELCYVSLYYKSDFITGANKRFDEIGERLFKHFGDQFQCVVTSGQRPHWCPKSNCVEIFSFKSKLGKLRSWLELSILLGRFSKGVVISDFLPLPFYILSRSYVHYQLIHDLRNFNEFKRGGLGKLTSIFQKYQLQSADKIITVSKFSARELVGFCDIDNKNIVVSYNGLDSCENIIGRNINRDIDILYVATYEVRKNHSNLLKALSYLHQPLSICFVGSDLGLKSDVLKICDELALSNGHTFTNYSQITNDELEEIYSRTKVFCSPSYYEGFGMPIIEAYQHGCIVCCSDIEVFREVTFSTGIYFDPKSPELIKGAINEALQKLNSHEDKLAIAEQCRKVTSFYSWDNITKRLIGALEENHKNET